MRVLMMKPISFKTNNRIGRFSSRQEEISTKNYNED